MDAYFYLLYVIAFIVLLTLLLSSFRRDNWLSASNVLLLVIFALIYDNLILGIGSWIGEGPFLETLNSLRFWLHAFFTPLLVLFSWDTLNRASINWAGNKASFIIAIVLTGALILLELFLEVFNLTLQPEWKFGVLKYVPIEEASSGPPLMILFVTIALLLAGIILWWKTKWKWMLIGVLLMIAGSVISFPIESDAVTNMFELILLASLVFTKLHQDRYHKQ